MAVPCGDAVELTVHTQSIGQGIFHIGDGLHLFKFENGGVRIALVGFAELRELEADAQGMLADETRAAAIAVADVQLGNRVKRRVGRNRCAAAAAAVLLDVCIDRSSLRRAVRFLVLASLNSRSHGQISEPNPRSETHSWNSSVTGVAMRSLSSGSSYCISCSSHISSSSVCPWSIIH